VVGEGGYDKRAGSRGRRRGLRQTRGQAMVGEGGLEKAVGQLRRLGLNKSGQTELAAPTSSATTMKDGWKDGRMDGW